MVRNVTISGYEFLPSKGRYRGLFLEIMHLEKVLDTLGISRLQLVDLAILVGAGFNQGVDGVGSKNALKKIKQYGSLEKMPKEIREPKYPSNIKTSKNYFLT